MKRTQIVRRTPLRSSGSIQPSPLARRRVARKLWQRAEDDKVTPALAQKVLARDGRCMAAALDPDLRTLCKDTWGNTLQTWSYAERRVLQLDHVPDENKTAMGDRPPSDEFHLIAVCPNHHLNGWATSVHGRNIERKYLRGKKES